MSMITVKPVLAAVGAGASEIERRIQGSFALSGLMGLGLTSSADAGADQPWWQSLLSSWSNTGQQILLNNNPTVSYTSGPAGTTVYYPNSTTPQATQTNATGAMASMMPVALIGGIALLAVVMMKK